MQRHNFIEAAFPPKPKELLTVKSLSGCDAAMQKLSRRIPQIYNNELPSLNQQYYTYDSRNVNLPESSVGDSLSNAEMASGVPRQCHATAQSDRVIARQAVIGAKATVGRFFGSYTAACICFLLAIFISPRQCVQSLIFPVFRLLFGTLYPAYASYKAVRTKNVKEYVKWMMYWIVYAFFTCIETFTDIFLSWFPFYYEVKVVIVIWLLSPATRGSSTLYRKFVHPALTRRENEIDEYLNQAKERGYSAVLQLGSKGVNYATNVIMQTALKGGGNLVQTIRRSYSLSDLSEPDVHRTQDEVDEVISLRPQQRVLRPRMTTALSRSSSGTRHSTGMYFTEVDLMAKGTASFNSNIRSSEDISSGYSSAEPVSGGYLSRTSSMTNATKARLKSKRSEIELDDRIQLGQGLVANYYVPLEMLHNFKDTVLVESDGVTANEVKFGSATEEMGVDYLLEENKNEDVAQCNQTDKNDEDSVDEFFGKKDESDGNEFLDALSDASVGNDSEMSAFHTENLATVTASLRANIAEHPFNHGQSGEPATNTRILHAPNKGKAPAPPLPPRPNRVQPMAADTMSLSSVCSSSHSRSRSNSPAPRKSIFKNIRSNFFRHKSQALQPNTKIQTSYGWETQI